MAIYYMPVEHMPIDSVSERKVSASCTHAGTTTEPSASFSKMSLCRACLVLLNSNEPNYNLSQDKDLAAKFIGCLGAGESLKYLNTPLDNEDMNQYILLRCICECCYQLVQKFHDFQRMCEESLTNFAILMSEVTDEKDSQEDESKTQFKTEIQENTKEVTILPQSKDFILPESIEDIEEVYIIENEHAKDAFKMEAKTGSTSPTVYKRPRGVRYKIGCTICSRGFYKPALFDAHMQKHQGLEPYKCTVAKCEKSYSRANLLKAHMEQVHTNEKASYPCTQPYCNRVYSSLRSLNYHLAQLHSDDPKSINTQYICDKCGKSYGRKAHLDRHQWVHKSKDDCNFNCNLCGHRFYTDQNLKNHFTRRHSDKPLLRCKLCGRIFGSQIALSSHMRRHAKKL